MEKLLYSIWNIWALIVFFLVGLVFLPVMTLLLLLIPTKSTQNICNYLFKTGGFIALILIGIIPVFQGDYKALKQYNKYVYIANHRAYLDILIGVIFTSVNTRFLSKAEVFEWPIIGFFTKKLGHIPVDRSSAKARTTSLQQIKQNVIDGKSLILFPEGRIHKNTNLLNSFKNGAFSTAIETETPIVCLTLLNAGIINPSHSKPKIRPGILKVKFSEPIPTVGKSKKDIDAIKSKAYDIMHGNLLEQFPDGIYPMK